MVQSSEMPMNHQGGKKKHRKQYYDGEHYIGFTSVLENILLSYT